MKNEKKTTEIEPLHNYVSGLRQMVSDSHKTVYQALHSLDEAKLFTDGVVILEGDDGGQIYVVAPVALVRCDDTILRHLLKDLDHLAWPNNKPNAAHIYYERHLQGTTIAGGMGGAIVTNDVWVHERFRNIGLEMAISDVIKGYRKRIGCQEDGILFDSP